LSKKRRFDKDQENTNEECSTVTFRTNKTVRITAGGTVRVIELYANHFNAEAYEPKPDNTGICYILCGIDNSEIIANHNPDQQTHSTKLIPPGAHISCPYSVLHCNNN
jgi:hypothetical protein